MSVVPGPVDAERARELAWRFVGPGAELTLCEGTPAGLYALNASEHFYFVVVRLNSYRIGGDEYASVSKVTGLVRSEGTVGD